MYWSLLREHAACGFMTHFESLLANVSFFALLAEPHTSSALKHTGQLSGSSMKSLMWYHKYNIWIAGPTIRGMLGMLPLCFGCTAMAT
jgi:hypothetical protein